MQRAASKLEGRALDGATAAAVERALGPLLDPEYPTRELSAAPDRIPGIGPKAVGSLARKGIHSVEQLLLFLPRSYEDRRVLVPIEELRVGHAACFEGRVSRAAVVPLRNGRRVFQAVVTDGTAAVQLKWFRQIPHFSERIQAGVRLLVAGEVRRYRYAKEIYHPEVEVLAEDVPVETLARIVPVYSLVEGLPPRTLRRLVESAVRHAADLLDGYLSEGSVRALGLPPVGESLRQVHLPGSHLDPAELRERRTGYHLRLVAEELFLMQAGIELRRARLARRSTRPLPARGPVVERALAGLPFELTEDQRVAWREIAADLGRPRPMQRLLVGDVGTGKTVLAVLASIVAHASSGVTAVLAPTEILAEQHARTFRSIVGPLGLRVALVTGSTSPADRRALDAELARGQVPIVIGTHALLSESLVLREVRLVVIDEQHRFGVAQRQLLDRKGDHPHVLVMTATPIPRTLALTVYGELDHSELRRRPPGHAGVETRVLPGTAGREALSELRRTLERGEQAYVVYPLVSESEKQDLKDATRGYERLKRALPGVSIALLHGRLEPRDRHRRMAAFVAGEVAILVATTVIEVGVDVSSATLLVVQHAERFGLAQLHQLRGRVGRGQQPGRAILMGDPTSEDASRRLAILERTDSGFEIAEEDLRIRGPGQWLGTRQSGHLPELRLADLLRHGDLLPALRRSAAAVAAGDPDLEKRPDLRAAIERRWGRRLDFGAVS